MTRVFSGKLHMQNGGVRLPIRIISLAQIAMGFGFIAQSAISLGEHFIQIGGDSAMQ